MAPVAGLASRHVELFTSVHALTLATEEDVYSVPSGTHSLAGLRPDPLALSTFTSRFPEAGLCRKLQDSRLEQALMVFGLFTGSLARFLRRIFPSRLFFFRRDPSASRRHLFSAHDHGRLRSDRFFACADPLSSLRRPVH